MRLVHKLPPPMVVVVAAYATWSLFVVAIALEPPASPADAPTANRQPAGTDKPRFRKPVAVAWIEEGRLLAVGNSSVGTVSLIDVSPSGTLAVVDETAVASRLTDLVRVRNSQTLIALDDRTHEFILLEASASGLQPRRLAVTGRVKTSRSPVRAVVVDEATVAVACLWARRVDIVALPKLEGKSASNLAALPRVVRSIAMPFAPREMVALGGASEVVVADSFGGRLAVVDVRRGIVTGNFTVPGHNIRGLAVNDAGRELIVAQQVLNEQLPATRDNLIAGTLVANIVRRLPLANLSTQSMSPDEPKILAGASFVLDELAGSEPGGAGDPDDIASLDDGGALVVLAGVDELALVGRGGRITWRAAVGARPQAAAFDLRGNRAFVASMLDDQLTAIDLTEGRIIAVVLLGATPEPWPRDRGERLFFDARLSAGGLMSCHSCHTDGHANARLADTLGDNSYGTPKRVMSLLGTALTDHWAWNGEIRELRDQVRKSVEQTMHARAMAPERHDDIVAFLHTLRFAPPPLPEAADAQDARLLAAGKAVFEQSHCAECHVPPLTYTSQTTYDVGLRDQRGLAKFNPPSLRGVGQADSLLHDGRCRALEDVFEREAHPGAGPVLTSEEVKSLARYLRSL